MSSWSALGLSSRTWLHFPVYTIFSYTNAQLQYICLYAGRKAWAFFLSLAWRAIGSPWKVRLFTTNCVGNMKIGSGCCWCCWQLSCKEATTVLHVSFSISAATREDTQTGKGGRWVAEDKTNVSIGIGRLESAWNLLSLTNLCFWKKHGRGKK